MLMRMLVNQFIRQTAQRKIYEEVSKRAGSKPAAGKAQKEEDSSAEPEPLPPCDVAFVFALGIESGGFVDLLQDAVTTRCPTFVEHAGKLNGLRIVIAESGVGAKNAEKATQDVITIHNPAWIVSAGFAGALNEKLERRHILMADHVISESGDSLDVGLKMDPQVVQSTKGLHVGKLLTVDRIIRTTKEKLELGARFEATACDMETMAIADVCRSADTRFLSVRIISDGLEDELPVEVEKLMNQKSIAGKIGAVTGALFQRPSVLKDMWKLKEDAIKASDRLAKFLTGVLPQLVSED